jgi:hypothetical protein
MNWIVSAVLPPIPTYKALENLSFLLGPNMGIWFRVDPIGDIKLTDDERHRIDNGLASLWVFGAFPIVMFSQSLMTSDLSLGGTWRVGSLLKATQIIHMIGNSVPATLSFSTKAFEARDHHNDVDHLMI